MTAAKKKTPAKKAKVAKPAARTATVSVKATSPPRSALSAPLAADSAFKASVVDRLGANGGRVAFSAATAEEAKRFGDLIYELAQETGTTYRVQVYEGGKEPRVEVWKA